MYYFKRRPPKVRLSVKRKQTVAGNDDPEQIENRQLAKTSRRTILTKTPNECKESKFALTDAVGIAAAFRNPVCKDLGVWFWP